MKKFNNFNPMDMINMMQNLQPSNKQQQGKNNTPNNTASQPAPQNGGVMSKTNEDNTSVAKNPLDNNPNVMKYIKRHNEIAKRIATTSAESKDK